MDGHAIAAVADSGYAALAFLAACSRWRTSVAVATRLRLDAALYEPALPRRLGQQGRLRLKGQRLPALAVVAADPETTWTDVTVAQWYGVGERTVEVVTGIALWYHTGLPPVPMRWVLIRNPVGHFDTQALLCTDAEVAPEQILAWFVLRWQLEVTLEEVRRHLGVELQWQWSDAAIRRTTLALLGLFSLIALLAHEHMADPAAATRQAAWYRKAHPTFADALALVRRELWRHRVFHTSSSACEVVNAPRALVEHLTEALCYVAFTAKVEIRTCVATVTRTRINLQSGKLVAPEWCGQVWVRARVW